MAASEDDVATFNVLVIGSIGDGKSSLIKALIPPDYPLVPDCAKAGRGGTKECRAYPSRHLVGVNLIDSPGIGDYDSKLGKILPQIEEYFNVTQNWGGVDCVVFTCPVGQDRLTLGAQIASAVLKASVFGTRSNKNFSSENKLTRLIVCGTKADKEDEEDRQEWMACVAPVFQEKLGKPPGKFVFTGVRKTAKGRGKDEVQSLLNAIGEVKDASRGKMHYHQIEETELLRMVVDSTGYDVNAIQIGEMAAEMKAMREQVKEQREHYDQILEKIKAQVEDGQTPPIVEVLEAVPFVGTVIKLGKLLKLF